MTLRLVRHSLPSALSDTGQPVLASSKLTVALAAELVESVSADAGIID